MSDIIDAEVVVEGPTTAAIVPTQRQTSSLVTPAAEMDKIAEAFQAYQEMKLRLLNDDDYQNIQGKRFPKKSAWRKMSVAFGCSVEVQKVTHERNEQGRIVRTEVVARATAPNGRYSDGLGSCDLFEKCSDRCEPNCNGSVHFSHAQHDIPATAETRAKNRALSDLFGFGEVSAEEVADSGGSAPARANTSSYQNSGPVRRATENQVKYIGNLLRDIDCDLVDLGNAGVIADGIVTPTDLSSVEASAVIEYAKAVKAGTTPPPERGAAPVRLDHVPESEPEQSTLEYADEEPF